MAKIIAGNSLSLNTLYLRNISFPRISECIPRDVHQLHVAT